MHDDMACELVCFEVSPLVPGTVGFRSQTFFQILRTDHQAMKFIGQTVSWVLIPAFLVFQVLAERGC